MGPPVASRGVLPRAYLFPRPVLVSSRGAFVPCRAPCYGRQAPQAGGRRKKCGEQSPHRPAQKACLPPHHARLHHEVEKLLGRIQKVEAEPGRMKGVREVAQRSGLRQAAPLPGRMDPTRTWKSRCASREHGTKCVTVAHASWLTRATGATAYPFPSGPLMRAPASHTNPLRKPVSKPMPLPCDSAGSRIPPRPSADQAAPTPARGVLQDSNAPAWFGRRWAASAAPAAWLQQHTGSLERTVVLS